MAETTSQLSILVKLRDEASGAMQRLGNQAQDLAGSMNFLGDKAGIVAGALSAIGTAAFFGAAISQAREANREWLKTETVIKAIGGNFELVKKTAEGMAETSTFQAHEIGLAFAKNLSIFGDTQKAIDKTKLAMDIAAFSGMSLEQAQRMIGRASDENIMALRRLAEQFGINIGFIDEHADKSVQFEIILNKLAEAARGFDQTLLESDGLTQLKKQWDELLQLVGDAVIPTLNFLLKEMVIPMIRAIRDWQQEHPKLFEKIVLVIGGFTALIAILGTLLALMPVFITLFKIAAAVAALLAGSTGIGLVVLIIGLLIFNITVLKDQWIAAWELLKMRTLPIIETIRGWIMSVVDAVRWLKDLLAGGFRIGATIFESAKRSIGGILGFQEGGIVTRPTLAMVGEGGEAEAIIPLSKLRGAGGGITINLTGDFYTTGEVAERFANEIARIIKYQVRL